MSDAPRDCIHGQLARSCELCDLQRQLAVAQARIAELQRVNGRLDNALERSGQQLAARDAEVTHYATALKDVTDAYEARDAEIAADNLEIARIAVLLRKYGVHLSSCRTHYREVGMPSLATDCDCGLQAAIDRPVDTIDVAHRCACDFDWSLSDRMAPPITECKYHAEMRAEIAALRDRIAALEREQAVAARDQSGVE